MKKMRFEPQTLITTIIFILTISMTTLVSGQQINQKTTFSNTEDIDYNIEYFKVMQVENTLYFKYLINENENEVTYVLEHSINGENFTEIDKKNGFKSPNQIPLLYCFNDAKKDQNTISYRIKRITSDGETSYTCNLNIEDGNSDRKWNKCISQPANKEVLKKLNYLENNTIAAK